MKFQNLEQLEQTWSYSINHEQDTVNMKFKITKLKPTHSTKLICSLK